MRANQITNITSDFKMHATNTQNRLLSRWVYRTLKCSCFLENSSKDLSRELSISPFITSGIPKENKEKVYRTTKPYFSGWCMPICPFLTNSFYRQGGAATDTVDTEVCSENIDIRGKYRCYEEPKRPWAWDWREFGRWKRRSVADMSSGLRYVGGVRRG